MTEAGLDPRTFRLLLISAMYENGGNTTHRLLDGHPELYVYPFESQLGTRLVNDQLTSLFPVKYRWPVFSLAATPPEDYHAIIDEELKVRLRTPGVSKFRHVELDLDDDARCARYVELIELNPPRSRAANVAAFFAATFSAWRNRRTSGLESVYVGYSPIIAVDADRILADLPAAHLLHIVRNPWSAYADTKKRPMPLSLADYLTAWILVQYAALVARERFPTRMHLVRFEDVIQAPETVLGSVCRAIGVAGSPSLAQPTWNGQPLAEVYPWGTIRHPTPQANQATATELLESERYEIWTRARPLLVQLGYDGPPPGSC